MNQEHSSFYHFYNTSQSHGHEMVISCSTFNVLRSSHFSVTVRQAYIIVIHFLFAETLIESETVACMIAMGNCDVEESEDSRGQEDSAPVPLALLVFTGRQQSVVDSRVG